MKRKGQVDKLLAATGFALVTGALWVVVGLPPSAGYELCVYDAYPGYFWVFLVVATGCGIMILVHQSVAEAKSKWWLAGLCLVIFSNCVLLGVPFFRGYGFFPIGDAMTHIGMIKDIEVTGRIGFHNFYPMVHLQGFGLANVAGLSAATLVNVSVVAWSVYYLLGTYLLATVLARDHGQALLITAFACPLLYRCLHVVMHPSAVSVFTVCLLVGLCHKKGKLPSLHRETTILLIPVAFFVTFAHPITCLFVIALLVALNLSVFLYRLAANRKEPVATNMARGQYGYGVAHIMFAAFCAWYSSYAFIQGSARRALNFLIHGEEVPLLSSQLNTLAESGLTLSQTIELFINRHGSTFTYLLMSVVALAIVSRWSFDKKAAVGQASVACAVLFVVGIAASVYSLYAYTGEAEPWRISRFFLVFVPVLCGMVSYDLAGRNQQRQISWSELEVRGKMVIVIVAALILTVATLSVFSIYGSPRTVATNWQASRMEIQGVEWFSNHLDSSIVTCTVGTNLTRFQQLLFGKETCSVQKGKYDARLVPSHLGYDENRWVAQTFKGEDRYLLVSAAGRATIDIFPESVRPKVHQYAEEDFARLKTDPTAERIYTDDEFEAWLVHGESGMGTSLVTV